MGIAAFGAGKIGETSDSSESLVDTSRYNSLQLVESYFAEEGLFYDHYPNELVSTWTDEMFREVDSALLVVFESKFSATVKAVTNITNEFKRSPREKIPTNGNALLLRMKNKASKDSIR